MLPFRKPWLLAALIAVGAFLGLTAPLEASFRLRVEQVGSPDNGVVITDTANTGMITYSGTIGTAFIVNVTTGISKPILPLAGDGFIAATDLNSVNVSAAAGSTLRITLEDTDFTAGTNGNTYITQASIGGTLSGGGNTLTAQSWVNTGNAVPVLGPDQGPGSGVLAAIGGIPGGSTKSFTPTAFTTGPGAFSGTGINTFVKSGNYSMFTQVTVNFNSAGTVSFDSEHGVMAPVPAGLVLALTGMPVLGLGYLGRRRLGFKPQTA